MSRECPCYLHYGPPIQKPPTLCTCECDHDADPPRRRMTTHRGDPMTDRDVTSEVARAELRRLAEAATEGPWRATSCWHDEHQWAHRVVSSIQFGQLADTSESQNEDADAEFIAAANPQTILDLLDALDAAGLVGPDHDARVAAEAAWEVQRVINHWSSVPRDVLARRAAELADLEACRDRIAALADPATGTTDGRVGA